MAVPANEQAIFSIENICTESMINTKTADSPHVSWSAAKLWKDACQKILVTNMRFNDLHLNLLECAIHLCVLEERPTAKTYSGVYRF